MQEIAFLRRVKYQTTAQAYTVYTVYSMQYDLFCYLVLGSIMN